MSFRVRLRSKAQADIAGHTAWLEGVRGSAASNRWRTDLVGKVVAALEADPHRYPPADEGPDVGLDLRELVQGRGRQMYRVLFTIEPATATVHVHRVRHAAQDRLSPGDV